MTTEGYHPALHVLIVDDEPLARKRIRTFLEDVTDFVVVGEAATGTAAVEAIRELDPDVVLLDINLPEMSGLEVVRAIGVEEMPLTVFITAHDEHAIEAFETHAVDYLLKPFAPERFQQTLARLRFLALQTRAATRQSLVTLLGEDQQTAEYAERFAVRSGNRLILVNTNDINVITTEGNYVRLHTDSRTHLMRETMTNMERRLDPDLFVRINRSAIVRISEIAELESIFQGEYVVVMKDGHKITSGRRYRAELERAARIT